MADFNPLFPYNVPAHILTPTTTIVKGVPVKTYTEPSEDNLIFCSFKSYGGTESTSNDVLTVLDTANVEAWYRPDIKANCRLVLAEDLTRVYEIMGVPEDINMRHQFVKFKVQRVAGGA